MIAASGCAQVLGIDGNYVTAQEQQGPSNGGANTGGSGGGDGGASGGGGTESGGTGNRDAGNGGTAAAAGSGGASGSGATVNAGCAPGDVTGTFDGFDKPAATVVGVDANFEATTWAFSLSGGTDTSNVENGHFTGSLKTALPQSAGTFEGTLQGTLDCKTGTIDGTVTGGVAVLDSISPIVLPPSPFKGTWTGKLKGQVFSGSWSVVEDIELAGGGGAPNQCVAGTTMMGKEDPGTGCGTWTAQ